jgi:hypothetical protein
MNVFLDDRIENLVACYRFLKNYQDSLKERKFSNEIEKNIETIVPGYFPTFLAKYENGTLEISLKHLNLFELCVMSTTLESYYRGVDQFPPGIYLEKMDYTQFAIFAHYSSIFHLVDSFLSIHGLIFIPSPKNDVEIVPTQKPEGLPERLVHIFPTMRLGQLKKRNGDPIEAVKATARMLTKGRDKRWIFEPTNLRHETRWEEFGKLLLLYLDNGLSDQIPKNLRYFIEYFGNHILIGSPEWGDYNAVENDAHLKILIPKACRNIPKVRHEAIYRNEAWDKAAKYASKILKQEDLPMDPLKYKIYHTKQLNISLLKWQTEIISTFVEATKKQLGNDSIFLAGHEKCVQLAELLEMSSKHITEEKEGLNIVNPKIKDIIWEILKIKTKEVSAKKSENADEF